MRMSQQLTLEISDEVYADLQRKSSAAGVSISEWIVTLLRGKGMSRKTVQPPECFNSRPWGFSQAVIGPTNGTLVTIAGQVAWDSQENIVGNTKWEQMRAAINHVIDAVSAAGGSINDIMHLQIHIVDFHSDESEKLASVLIETFGTDSPPSSTWIGVTSLARPEYLVEIQGIAVLSASSS